MDFAASRIRPTPTAAALIAPPVEFLIDAVLNDESSLGKCDDITPLVDDILGGNGGRIRPQSVPPKTR